MKLQTISLFGTILFLSHDLMISKILYKYMLKSLSKFNVYVLDIYYTD